jgi:hypothetical protein
MPAVLASDEIRLWNHASGVMDTARRNGGEMTAQRKKFLYWLVPILLFPWIVGVFGGVGEWEALIWLGLILGWVIGFAFTTKSGEPLKPYVRNTMIGVLVVAALGCTVAGLSAPRQDTSVTVHNENGPRH